MLKFDMQREKMAVEEKIVQTTNLTCCTGLGRVLQQAGIRAGFRTTTIIHSLLVNVGLLTPCDERKAAVLYMYCVP